MFTWTIKKLGPILVNKVVQKLKFLKNVNNKKPAPKLIFFNEKKINSVKILGGATKRDFQLFATLW